MAHGAPNSARAENSPGHTLEGADRYRQVFDRLAIAVWEHDFTILAEAIAQLRLAGVTDFRRYVAEHPEFVRAMRQQVPITDVNRAALELFGLSSQEAFVGRLQDLLDPHDESFAQGIVAMAEGAPAHTSECMIRHADGGMIPVFIAIQMPSDGRYDAVSVSLFDARVRLDAERRLERSRMELEQAARAAALAELSAAIAHEITQPLSAIVNLAETSRQWLRGEHPDVAEAVNALDELDAASRYATEVVKRVRGLLEHAKPDREPIAVDTVIRAAVDLVRRAVPVAQAVILSDLQAPDALVRGDNVLLQQAIVILLNNGLQSVQTISERSRFVAVSSRVDADGVTIIVADTGPGFTREALQNLFRTFFTTKAQGTGLGLSIARSTIRAHDGEITVANGGLHGGARVTVRLPLWTPSDDPPGPRADPDSQGVRGGRPADHR